MGHLSASPVENFHVKRTKLFLARLPASHHQAQVFLNVFQYSLSPPSAAEIACRREAFPQRDTEQSSVLETASHHPDRF